MVPAPSSNDLRRRDRIVRYKPYVPKEGEDPMAEYMNLLAMLFSMCGLMMRFKWAAWAAVSALYWDSFVLLLQILHILSKLYSTS